MFASSELCCNKSQIRWAVDDFCPHATKCLFSLHGRLTLKGQYRRFLSTARAPYLCERNATVIVSYCSTLFQADTCIDRNSAERLFQRPRCFWPWCTHVQRPSPNIYAAHDCWGAVMGVHAVFFCCYHIPDMLHKTVVWFSTDPSLLKPMQLLRLYSWIKLIWIYRVH